MKNGDYIKFFKIIKGNIDEKIYCIFIFHTFFEWCNNR